MGLFRSVFDLFRGASNDIADKITDPARAARLAQEDLRSIDKNAIEALATITARRMDIEKRLNNINKDIERYNSYAEKAASNGNSDLARKALEQLRTLRTQHADIEGQYQKALADENTFKEHVKNVEKQRLKNLDRAKTLEAQAELNKSAKKVSKLLDSQGNLGGSYTSKLDKLESKVNKEQIKNEAYQQAAQGASYNLEQEFKDLDSMGEDEELDKELALLMAKGKVPTKEALSIEEKKAEPIPTYTQEKEVEHAVPESGSIEAELEELRKK